jgi:hypothetical protein
MKVVQIITLDVQPGGMQDRLIEKAQAHMAITEEVADRVASAAADRLQFCTFDTDTHGFHWHDIQTDEGRYRIRYVGLEAKRLTTLFDEVTSLREEKVKLQDELNRLRRLYGGAGN